MNTISYLKEIYGYGVPIFLKDIRIGQKSKLSIRKDLSRGVEKGVLIRKAQGIYCLKPEGEDDDTVTFNKIITVKYLKNDYGIEGLDLDIYGYQTGLGFLHSLGLTQQVPAVPEIVTNNTSCKRIINIKGREAIIRKPIIPVNRFNYKTLQFIDCLYLLDLEEIKENYKILCKYVRENISKGDLERYLLYYPASIVNKFLSGGLFSAAR